MLGTGRHCGHQWGIAGTGHWKGADSRHLLDTIGYHQTVQSEHHWVFNNPRHQPSLLVTSGQWTQQSIPARHSAPGIPDGHYAPLMGTGHHLVAVGRWHRPGSGTTRHWTSILARPGNIEHHWAPPDGTGTTGQWASLLGIRHWAPLGSGHHWHPY